MLLDLGLTESAKMRAAEAEVALFLVVLGRRMSSFWSQNIGKMNGTMMT